MNILSTTTPANTPSFNEWVREIREQLDKHSRVRYCEQKALEARAEALARSMGSRSHKIQDKFGN